MNPYEKLAYRQLDILTADPLELIAKTFHLAAASCDEARRACEQGDIAAKGESVNKVSTALALLKGHLDRDRGGEVAATMDRAYSLLLGRLITAHAGNDLKVFDEVAGHLRGLGSAWEEAARRRKAESDSQASSGKTEAATVDLKR